LKLGAKVPVEHINIKEVNDYDQHLFDRFQRLHQKFYLDDKGFI
jgi:hypothetical protein